MKLFSGKRSWFLQNYNKFYNLKPKEEFPQKSEILVESLITSEGAKHFLEITGGLMTRYKNDELTYEIFEPSEALAGW